MLWSRSSPCERDGSCSWKKADCYEIYARYEQAFSPWDRQDIEESKQRNKILKWKIMQK